MTLANVPRAAFVNGTRRIRVTNRTIGALDGTEDPVDRCPDTSASKWKRSNPRS